MKIVSRSFATLPLLLGGLSLTAAPGCGPLPVAGPPPVVAVSAPVATATATAVAAPGCPDDLRVSLAVRGSLTDGSHARFVFETMATKLDAIPASALPDTFDRHDPRAYTSMEQGSHADPSRPIPRKLAIELGGADDDSPIAVYTDKGGPPCMGTPGDFHVVLRAEGWYEPYVEVQRRILGCDPTEGEKGPAFTARASTALDQCTLKVPGALASATFPSVDGKTPAKIQGALPADLAAFGPPDACAAPGCLRAFTLHGVEPPAGPSLYAVSISQLRTQANDEECAIYAEQRCSYVQSLVIRPSPGAAPSRIDVDEADLGAVFLDPRGARFFVALTHGGMVVGRVSAGAKPTIVRSVQTYHPHPEDSDFESHSSCPYCGP